jgi:hypothetical protein
LSIGTGAELQEVIEIVASTVGRYRGILRDLLSPQADRVFTVRRATHAAVLQVPIEALFWRTSPLRTQTVGDIQSGRGGPATT